MKDPNGPVFICMENILKSDDDQRKAALLYTYNTFVQDVHQMDWLSSVIDPNYVILSDYSRHRLISYGMLNESNITLLNNPFMNKFEQNKTFYLSLSYNNVKHGIMIFKNNSISIGGSRVNPFSTVKFAENFKKFNLIYDSGESKVYTKI
jgi:uncharacterized membrane protein